MVITQPPGYKLYTHLFHSAMRKLNHKIIKFQLLKTVNNYIKNMYNCPKFSVIKSFRYNKNINEYNKSTECEKKAIKRTKRLYNYLIHNCSKKERAVIEWYKSPIPIDYLDEYVMEFIKYEECCPVLIRNKLQDIPLCKYEFYYNLPILKNIIKCMFKTFVIKGEALLDFIYKYIDCNKDGPLKDIKNDVLKTIEHINKPMPPTKATPNPKLRKINILDRCNIDIIEKYINILEKYFTNFWKKIGMCKSITPEFIEKYENKNWGFITPNTKNRINLDFIEKHINKSWWDWELFSQGGYINLDLSYGLPEKRQIKYYPDKSIEFTIPEEFVKKYSNKIGIGIMLKNVLNNIIKIIK